MLSHRNLLCLVFLPIILLFNNLAIGQPSFRESFPMTMNQLTRIALSFEANLMDVHRQHSRMAVLPNRDDEVIPQEVDVQNLLSVMENKIFNMFGKRKRILKKIVDNLEESSKTYKWDDNLKTNHTNLVFLNAETEKKYKNNPGELRESFGVNINETMVGIHIPIEIYEGYPEVLNGLNWSSSVDDVFKHNLEDATDLSWQYFASKSGFMRLYPAVTKWYIPPPYDVDLFDAERRPWYIRGSASPKDVLILMDRSGSVHGQTFTIMKFAVQTLLDTLDENDYVNVAAFNETTFWVSEIIHTERKATDLPTCRNYKQTLLQASYINKKSLIDDIQELPDMGMSNYSSAVEFAYEVFKKRANSVEQSSNCHKLVMLFSDGGTDWPEAVFKRFENDTDTEDIRIFTYAIGAHPIPTAVLKQMACKTGGKFTSITTSSGVRTKIQKSYIDKISEPLAEAGTHLPHHTSAYTSGVTANLTLSLTMPVFNLSDSEHKELAGVAGIDIPIHHLNNLTPREVLGPLGYAFIVNQNGFLLMHPRLHAQHSYLESPPSLDLLDLELNPEQLEQMRKQIINLNTNSRTVTGKVLMDMNHIVDRKRLKYHFLPIRDTTYSLGMVTESESRHLRIKRSMPESVLDDTRTILAPWHFCGTQPMNGPKDLKKFAKRHHLDCDKVLLDGLFWAHGWMYPLTKKWKASEKSEDIINKALYTRFGIAFVTESSRGRTDDLKSNATMNDTQPREEPFGREWRDPNKNPALKRGLLIDGLSIFPHKRGAFVSKPASVSSVVVAAVGINVTSKLLDRELKAARASLPPHSSHILIVDDSATIISSSLHENSSGEFLGERWPELLKKLIDVGIYDSENVSDFQAICEGKSVSNGIVSAGINLDTFFSPLKFATKTIFQLLSMIEFMQYAMLHGFMATMTQEVAAVSKVESKEACIIEHTIYHFTDKKDYEGTMPCKGTSPKILVVRFNSINAILIAVEDSLIKLGCDCWNSLSTVDEHECYNPMQRRVVKPKQLACEEPRYRRGPVDCEMSTPKKCSGSAGVAGYQTLVILMSFFLLLKLPE